MPPNPVCLLVTRHHTDVDPPPKIEIVASLKLLGVHLNNKLTWDAHIENLRVTCSRRLHILRKLKRLISYSKLHTVYTTLIRSRMEYACPLFVGMKEGDANTLRKIESRAHRIMSQGCTESICCNRHSLKERRLQLSKRLWKRMETDPQHLLHSLIPHRLARTEEIFLASFRTNNFGNSFFRRPI